MKKLLTVLATLVLAASFCTPAHAGGSKLRTVTLPWGQWGPSGFVPSSSSPNDTTYISGATAMVDTTGPISTTDWDWLPYTQSTSANIAHLNVFKIFAAGTLVSTDSAFVSVEASMDGGSTWATFTSSSAFTMTQIGAGGGTQQVLATPVNLIAPARGALAANSSTATIGIAPYPLLRFIFRGDGNTAARASGLKLSVAYHHTDGRDGHKPQLEWKQLRWATYNNDGFGGLRLASYKDTSSVTFSAPDTTEWFDLSNALIGPSQQASITDTLTLGAYLFVQQSSDVSSNDSIYVCVDGAAVPGYKWNLTPMHGLAGGFVAAAVSTQNTYPEALFGLPAFVSTALSAGPGALASTPFVRFRIFGGNGGEVAGGLKVWIAYWKNPYEAD